MSFLDHMRTNLQYEKDLLGQVKIKKSLLGYPGEIFSVQKIRKGQKSGTLFILFLN